MSMPLFVETWFDWNTQGSYVLTIHL